MEPCAAGTGFKEYQALTAIAAARTVKQPPKAILAPGKSGVDSRIQSLLKEVLRSLDDSKAEEIVTIDLAGKTSIADYMIIATGRSGVHAAAIANHLIIALKEAGVEAPRVEGVPQCDWVLVDAGDIIVHVFRPEVRQFYNLEKMWSGDRPVESAGKQRAM